MTRGPFEDTAILDTALIQATEAARIEARYGEMVWFGFFTKRWWAMVGHARLVEAATPDRLGQEIMAARRPA